MNKIEEELKKHFPNDIESGYTFDQCIPNKFVKKMLIKGIESLIEEREREAIDVIKDAVKWLEGLEGGTALSILKNYLKQKEDGKN